MNKQKNTEITDDVFISKLPTSMGPPKKTIKLWDKHLQFLLDYSKYLRIRNYLHKPNLNRRN